jgi:predicted dienelactone hydrolase
MNYRPAFVARLLILSLPTFALTACGDDEETTPEQDSDTSIDADSDAGPIEDSTSTDGSPEPDAVVVDDTATTDGSADVVTEPGWESWAFDEPGPYVVGHRVMEHTYESPATGEERTIKIHIWYPSESNEGEFAEYLGPLFTDENSFDDVALAPSVYGETYPLIAYSHGDQGFAGTSSFLMRHFVSQGWVAIGPDHTDNLLFTSVEPRPSSLYLHRSTDMSECLNVLEALPEGDPLAGVVDTTHVLLSGHSFGVHTIWTALGSTFDEDMVDAYCARDDVNDCTEQFKTALLASTGDDRFVAAIALAGTIRRSWFGDTGHQSVEEPILSLTGTDDPGNGDEQFESTPELELAWANLNDLCHQGFALGGCALISDEESFALVSAWSMAFARYYLLEQSTPDIRAQLGGENLDHVDRFESRLILE